MITIQGTVPIQTVQENYDDDNLTAAVADFFSKHPQARLEKINDDFVKGLTMCNRPVFERQSEYQYDFDAKRFLCTAPGCEVCNPSPEPAGAPS